MSIDMTLCRRGEKSLDGEPDARHEVTGSHNSPAGAELLQRMGAKRVRLDLLDAGAVRKAVHAFPLEDARAMDGTGATAACSKS